MTCLALDEYRRIRNAWQNRRAEDFFEELKGPDFWERECGTTCKRLASIEVEETFRIYATVTDEEMKGVKRQYLPNSIRHLSDGDLQKRLSEIDRQIIDRLTEGGTINDVRKEFESLPENGGGAVNHREFFESRHLKIIQRANLKMPKSWSRNNSPMILGSEPDGFDWDDPSTWHLAKKQIIWPEDERERLARRKRNRRESQRARRQRQNEKGQN